MVNDWIYAVAVYDENRNLYSVDDIEQRLRSVVQDATQRKQAGEKAVPVGILSSGHRDRWTEVRFFHVPSPCVSSLRAEP
jgi:carnitine O-acetyltransferase